MHVLETCPILNGCNARQSESDVIMSAVSIETDSNICKFTLHGVPDRPGMAAEVFGRLGIAGVCVHMMAAAGAEAGRTDISLTVAGRDGTKVSAVLKEIAQEMQAGPVGRRDDVVAVSLVADELDHQPGVAGRMFRTLSAQGINIDMISATNTAVTCLVDARFLKNATEALEKDFKAETVP